MNFRRILSQTALVAGALLFSVGVQTFAAFTAPTTAPPGADAYAPLHTGSDAQSKVGGLLLNTGGATNGLIVQFGNVGIGTTNPTAKLDIAGNMNVAGDVKIGNSNTACTTANTGSLRYNATGKKMEFCSPDGAGAGVLGWVAMNISVAAAPVVPLYQCPTIAGTCVNHQNDMLTSSSGCTGQLTTNQPSCSYDAGGVTGLCGNYSATANCPQVN